jgi:hypothetical protein
MPDTAGWVEELRNQPIRMWGLAILLYGGGDTLTSVVGFRTNAVSEVGLLARIAHETAGIGGFLLLKIGFCGLCIVTWYVLDTPGRVALPLALIVIGTGVNIWNLAMLLLG